ncbi:MAG: hypothetical protein EB084_24765, partial [Proteobacteria bacterium]|nr:hypothetical protein [Pseudomonadota bacterium]
EPAEPVPRFRGDAAHPVNHGALCARGAAATFEVSSRERLLTPLRRAPGQREWTTIAWDEALDIVSRGLLDARARTFDAARAAATGIGFFGGATAMNEEVWLFVRLARMLGVLDLDHQGRSCHAATTAALGATLGITGATHDWASLLDARSIVIIGANPADAHPIAARYLHGARARGARVTVIDPRASRTAQGADLHLSLRPGTDLMLLCGLINQLLARQREDTAWLEQRSDAGFLIDAAAELNAENGRFGGWDTSRRGYDTRVWSYRGQGHLTDASSVLSALRRHFARYTEAMVCAVTGLNPDDVRALADRVCDTGPTAVIFSMGVTQQLSGVATVRAAAILQALLGNLERAGGGLYPMKGHANIQGATDLGGLYHHLPGAIPAPTVDEPDLEAYAARYGEAPARHLRRLLRVWAADRAEAAYTRLPKRRDGDHHSLHAALARGDLEVVMLLGQNPVHGSGNPRAVEQALGRLRLLVSIDPFINETARFWERVPGCATEVLALPSAMFAEKPGSRTNACRRVQWQNSCLAPRGDSRPDGVMLRDIWTRIAVGLQMGRDEGAASVGAPDDAESTDTLYRRLHREITAG